MQLSFLNAFLKGIDDQGWTTGKASTVAYKVRKGNPGYNTLQAESSFEWRTQPAWPIPGTAYTRYWLTSSGGLQRNDHEELRTAAKLSYKTLGTLADPQLLEFSTPPFTQATEITGHVTARLSVSATREDSQDLTPMDMDVFVTLRHIVRSGEEALHTGTVGDPVTYTNECTPRPHGSPEQRKGGTPVHRCLAISTSQTSEIPADIILIALGTDCEGMASCELAADQSRRPETPGMASAP